MFAKRPPKRILAIDWDDRALRVVDARVGPRGARVERVLSVGVPPGVDVRDPAQMGAHIRAALEQEGIATHHAVVDIPRDQVVLNTLRLPCTNPDELPGIVSIQIAKDLPFPLTDASVDFALPPESTGEVAADVLVAAVRLEILEQYQAVCEAAGLKLARVGLRPYATKVAVCDLFEGRPPQRLLFVDVGASLTEIDVLRDGHLAYSRAASVHVPRALDDGPVISLVRDIAGDRDAGGAERPVTASATSIPRVVASLMMEVRLSLEAYRAHDPGAVIDQAVIGGDHGVEAALARALEDQLGIAAEVYNPAASFGWTPEQGVPASAFAASLGLVLAHAAEDRLHFDFLHPKRMVSATQKKLRRVPVAATVAVLFLAAGVVGLERVTRPQREELARVQSQIAELEPVDPDEAKLVKQEKDTLLKLMTQVTQVYGDGKPASVDLLYDLVSGVGGELLPREVIFRELSLESDRIVLHARTRERGTANVLVEKLAAYRPEGRETPLFKARVRSVSKPDEREEYPFSPEIEIEVLPDRTRRSRPGSG